MGRFLTEQRRKWVANDLELYGNLEDRADELADALRPYVTGEADAEDVRRAEEVLRAWDQR